MIRTASSKGKGAARLDGGDTMNMTEITVRVLDESEWSLYRDLRLRAPWQNLPVRLPRPWPMKLIVKSSSGATE